MATEPDPYRTLGLAPTASLAEVKAAYRRLAKTNHPDAAGEGSLPRFLAIQAAYERLAGPARGRPKGPTPGATPRKPWEADPDRSDATHRAYGGRARRPAEESGRRTGRTKSGTTSGSARPSGAKSRPPGSAGPSSRPAGSTGAGASSTSETAGGGRAGRGPKKATLGSTSYDEAEREAFEPDWVGASWYGTTSGTYWTINPKEYADPRKHGPEYQARARRAAAGRRAAAVTNEADGAGVASRPGGADGTDAAAPGPGDSASGTTSTGSPPPSESGASDPDGRPPSDADEPPRHTTSTWWEATSGPIPGGSMAGERQPHATVPGTSRPSATARPATTSPASRPDRARPASSPVGPTRQGVERAPAGPDALRRALTSGDPPSLGWRVARAVIGWLPIGLAIGWASGELTGCGRFSATCDPGTGPAVWVVQLAVLALLLALPVVAGWSVVAAFACLAVAIPATLLVVAMTGAAAGSASAFLGVTLVAAWLLGVVGAIVMKGRITSGPTGPVS